MNGLERKNLWKRSQKVATILTFPLKSRAVINSAWGKERQLKANALVTYFYSTETIMTMLCPFCVYVAGVVLLKVWYMV